MDIVTLLKAERDKVAHQLRALDTAIQKVEAPVAATSAPPSAREFKRDATDLQDDVLRAQAGSGSDCSGR